eukprot:TRINITY_DN32559_c0_g1_i1.p1 TRINITY_DN32559_c0_g1~~TRINITY_DN32559_c0_g1_i1.p1  ORF type:complete len:831 (+),score=213.00 TRINITY_DN32559_c0_g1_i1:57-2549(+)
MGLMACAALAALCAAAVGEGIDAGDCASWGARHIAPDDDDPVHVTPPPYLTEDFVAAVAFQSVEDGWAMPVWECADADGAAKVAVHALHNASNGRSTVYVKTANTSIDAAYAFDVPPRFALADGEWHRIAVNHSTTAGSLAVAVDGRSVGEVNLTAPAAVGARNVCTLGGSTHPSRSIVGSIRDFAVTAYVDGVAHNTSASACSGRCNGPYASRTPVRNLAVIPDTPITHTPLVIQFHLNVLDVVTAEQGVLLVGGGGANCWDETLASSVAVYVYPNEGGYGIGFRQRIVGRDDIVVETAPASVRLMPQDTHSVRLELSQRAQRVYIDGVISVKSDHAMRDVAAGSVSLGTACHDALVNASTAWFQVVVVGECDGLHTGALPRSELEPNPTPPPSVVEQPLPDVTTTELDAFWVPLASVGEVALVSRPVPGADRLALKHGLPGITATITGMAQGTYTQFVAFTTSAGLYYSEDGGVSYSVALAGVALDDAAMFANDTVMFFVSASERTIYRHEVGADVADVRAFPMPFPGAAAPTDSRVFANEAGEIFVSTNQRHVFLSTDGGMLFVYESDLSGFLGDMTDGDCLPLISAPSDRYDIPHPLHARRVVACGDRVFSLTHGHAAGKWNPWFEIGGRSTFTSITAIQKIRGYLYLIDGTRLYRGREKDPRATVVWNTIFESPSPIRSLTKFAPTGAPSGLPWFALLSDTQLHLSYNLGAAWSLAAALPAAPAPRGALAHLPTCTADSGCSGRGACHRGLVWPASPLSCSCEPPYAPPTCANRYTCRELQQIIGTDLHCKEPLEGEETLKEACEWVTTEVRPGIHRSRCLQPGA